MSNANKLLDKWMKVCSIKTQAEAARILGKAGSATISNWRSGYAKPDNESIALMCEQCGEDAAHWIGVLNLDFEQSPRLKKVWLRLAQAAASVAIIYAFSRIDVHHEAVASIVLAARNPGSLYIMSIVAASMMAVGMALAWKRSPRMEQRTWHATGR